MTASFFKDKICFTIIKTEDKSGVVFLLLLVSNSTVLLLLETIFIKSLLNQHPIVADFTLSQYFCWPRFLAQWVTQMSFLWGLLVTFSCQLMITTVTILTTGNRILKAVSVNPLNSKCIPSYPFM